VKQRVREKCDLQRLQILLTEKLNRLSPRSFLSAIEFTQIERRALNHPVASDPAVLHQNSSRDALCRPYAAFCGGGTFLFESLRRKSAKRGWPKKRSSFLRGRKVWRMFYPLECARSFSKRNPARDAVSAPPIPCSLRHWSIARLMECLWALYNLAVSSVINPDLSAPSSDCSKLCQPKVEADSMISCRSRPWPSPN
jgi:hypothetical protein